MSERITIERILRDDDDCSGQTIRQWKIEAEGGHITVRDREDHLPFLMMRPADIEIFVDDLRRARALITSTHPTPAPSAKDNSQGEA